MIAVRWCNPTMIWYTTSSGLEIRPSACDLPCRLLSATLLLETKPTHQNFGQSRACVHNIDHPKCRALTTICGGPCVRACVCVHLKLCTKGARYSAHNRCVVCMLVLIQPAAQWKGDEDDAAADDDSVRWCSHRFLRERKKYPTDVRTLLLLGVCVRACVCR